MFVVRVETDEMHEGCLTEIITTTDNLKLDSESTDDELKVLELQRAKRMKKKIAAKNSSNIAIQIVEISKRVIFYDTSYHVIGSYLC